METINYLKYSKMVSRNQRSSCQVKKKDAAGSFQAAFPLAAQQVNSQRELEVPRRIWMDDHTIKFKSLVVLFVGFQLFGFQVSFF